MTKSISTVAFGISLLITILLTACSQSEDPESVGTFRSALSTVSAQGFTYRLRQATFNITGPENVVVSSEDYLDQNAVVLDLAVGAYQIAMAPNWLLEKADANGQFATVDAVLLSESTQTFNIAQNQTSSVVFTFKAGSDVISLGDGSLAVQIGVDDSPTCSQGVTVTYAGSTLPADIAGQYVEAFDCTQEEGGAWFGGVDFAHCFRKNDGSSWRIWNTGCGWEYGLMVPSTFDPTMMEWERHARTYAGQCSAIPASQLGVDALTTTTFYDGFGSPISGLSSDYCPGDTPICSQGVTVTYAGSTLPADIAGQYVEAFDCTQEEGGAWFGGADFAHCFRKNDGSSWRIWNTGCGWEYGLMVPSAFDPTMMEWERHARTYAGQCSAIPASQLGVDALTTSTFYDGFGNPISDLSSDYCQ